ncbi:MAG: HAD family phosphatase [Ruminococcus sp.]|nr:HAD family phosphatase [Ruminococcus sp.]
MIRGAVFDMDGLMFDTENLTYKLQKEIMEKDFGVDFSLEQYKQTIGKRFVELPPFFKKLYGDDFDFNRFHESCRNAFISYTDEFGVPIKDGLFELLDDLKAKKIKIALATSTSRKSALRALKIAKVLDYFDEIVCADDVENGKPDPEPFLKAAEKLGVKPSECIALEDSFNGIKSAYNAGLNPIMVPDLIEPTDEIRQMCTSVLNSLNELKL